jgi:hypothetical protein
MCLTCEAACLAIVAVSHGPLKALLVPLLATFGALLSAMDDDVRWRLPVATQGRLPASLGRVKHDCLVVGSVLDGNVARLLKRVPKEIAMYALPVLSWRAQR